VPVETARAARAAAADAGADAVLCIGGGSTVGAAKAVALTARIPVLAVPTTYSGSEVTAVWGMTENGRKTTGTDPAVLPRVVVYDPELTAGLPRELAVASGLNAMAHGVEALWAPRRNPVSSVIAEEGVGALATGLRDADPAELLRGAWLAAAAFAVAGSGLHHKLCHVLGGTFGLPHARTHAVVLPHVLAFNAPGAPEAAARVARALGVEDPVRGTAGAGRRARRAPRAARTRHGRGRRRRGGPADRAGGAAGQPRAGARRGDAPAGARRLVRSGVGRGTAWMRRGSRPSPTRWWTASPGRRTTGCGRSCRA
jgi:maleylacetate reductase